MWRICIQNFFSHLREQIFFFWYQIGGGGSEGLFRKKQYPPPLLKLNGLFPNVVRSLQQVACSTKTKKILLPRISEISQYNSAESTITHQFVNPSINAINGVKNPNVENINLQRRRLLKVKCIMTLRKFVCSTTFSE